MNITEFYGELRIAAPLFRWRLAGEMIRGEYRQQHFCPLTATCQIVKGHHVSYGRPEDAGKELGLGPADIDIIANASDRANAHKGVRRRILQAVGLEP